MKQTRQPSFKGSSRVVLPEVILLSSAGSCPLMHICMYIMCHAYMHDRRTYAEARARAHSTRVHPRSPWTTLAYKLPNFLANRRRRERERETTIGGGLKGIAKGKVERTRTRGKKEEALVVPIEHPANTSEHVRRISLPRCRMCRDTWLSKGC